MMKRCIKCNELQPVENFGRDARRPDGARIATLGQSDSGQVSRCDRAVNAGS
jgi:hypothetical protein